MVERVKKESCSGILTATFLGITLLQVRILSSRFGMRTAIHKRLSIVNGSPVQTDLNSYRKCSS